MDRKVSFVLGTVLALFLAGSARAATFTMSFEGAPTGELYGKAGDVLTWDIYPLLTTTENTGADGAQGWQIGFAATGGTISGITLKGVIVDIIYDEDLQDGSPLVHHEHYDQDLSAKDMFNKGAFPASLSGLEPYDGVIGWAVFRGTEHAVLQPNGTARMMKTTLTATVPSEGCTDLNLKFVDGYKSSTSKPVVTAVTFASESIDVTKGLVVKEANWKVCKVEGPKPTFVLSAALAGENPAPTPDQGLTWPETVGTVEGEPGSTATFHVNVVITTMNLEVGAEPNGPQGWQISVANQKGCMSIESALLKGMLVDTFYWEDLQDGSPLVRHDHWSQDLSAKDMFNKGSAVAFVESDPDQKGAISWAVFKGTEKQVLYENAVDRVLDLTCTMQVPAADEPANSCRIFFLDGLKSDVSKPVTNAITYKSESIDQTKGLKFQNLTVNVVGKPVPTVGKFARGDANGDGKFDIADAVYVVYAVLQDAAYPLACKEAGDADADTLVTFPDAVYLINWQFRGQAAPPAPFPDCGAGSTVDMCPSAATQAKCL